MVFDLSGKRAVVCGASQGIGAAVARQMAERGVEVTLLARNIEKLNEVSSSLSTVQGQNHRVLSVDFMDPDSLGTSVSELINDSAPIHILVNNSGGPSPGALMESELTDLADAFTMHVLSYHMLTRLLVPGMKDAGYGRIINIISTSVKQPIENLGVSNTIRAAVANWSKTLSVELGRFSITVNNVLPGYTMTDRLDELIIMRANMAGVDPEEMKRRMSEDVPVKRLGEPEEIASAVLYLASPEAAFVNGVNLPVDGGRTKSL